MKERGSALPEAVLTTALSLLVFLGLIKLAFVGYEQAEVDGAAFVAAHAASYGYGTGSHSQKNHALTTVTNVFPKFPTGNISIATSTPGVGPNPNGDVVGYAYRKTGGLFLNQGFGGSIFTLHSHVVEPAAAPTYAPSNFAIVSPTLAKPPNCTTHNTATPTCGGIALATPNPSNGADPVYPYECRAAYYASLWALNPPTGADSSSSDKTSQYGTIVADFPNASPSLANLTDGYSNPLSDDAWRWPRNYGWESSGHSNSVNALDIRTEGVFLTEQFRSDGSDDTQNSDGQATQGGTAGRMLLPIFNLDDPTQTPC